MKRGIMSTIWDVAKLAGVSKSTVSRVMNNGASSEQSRDAVMAAAKKLNYQPSFFAKNIRTQKSMTLALLIPDASNLFYTEIFKAVEGVAFKQDYMVTLCDTQNCPEYEIKYTEKLLQRRIDGLIYATYKMNPKTQNYFVSLSKTLPIVFLDYAFKRYEEISIVATEGYDSSSTAVKFLFNKGKKNIAYINLPEDVEVTQHRYEGYKKGLEICGVPFSSDLVCFPIQKNEMSARDLGFSAAKQLLSTGKKIDAIMVASDPLAIGAMKYLKNQGIQIPSEICVIGFDNNEICDIVTPSLTTIAQPIRSVGTQAARILLNKINGIENKEERIFFKGELIQRRST
jgi:DNA-binding LacI/PurR family transcriptional regulator